jgi:glycolate oxidase
VNAPTPPPIDTAALFPALSAVLPKGALLTTVEQMRPYECDGLSMYRRLPLCVALPARRGAGRRRAEASATSGVPVVARGAGTGLSGGALPKERRAAVAGEDEAHRRTRSARADRPACSPVCATSRSAKPQRRMRLYYAPDPSSQIACSIGGNIAENSGGVHCLKYGLTVHNVCRCAS